MAYHVFTSSNGTEILVGRDDAGNDELTFSIGRADDVWLHVSGVPGSHVLLRCGDARGFPDRTCLKEAAALAAWYSKMRKGGKVSVNWCRVRDVRKPRGAKAGSVTIRNEQKLAVRPGFPPGVEPPESSD